MRRIHAGFDEIYIEMGLGDRRYTTCGVQEDLYRYRLEFVMKGELAGEDVGVLKAKYKEHLGDVNLTIRYLDKIPPTNTGKWLFVVPNRPT